MLFRSSTFLLTFLSNTPPLFYECDLVFLLLVLPMSVSYILRLCAYFLFLANGPIYLYKTSIFIFGNIFCLGSLLYMMGIKLL